MKGKLMWLKTKELTLLDSGGLEDIWHPSEAAYPEDINRETVLLAWQKCGRVAGLGDWRPQHGRFYVEEIN